MRLLTLIALIAFSSPARGEERPRTIPKEPLVLGDGYIAEVCKLSFADPVAQTACEVHIHMELDAKTQEFKRLQSDAAYLFFVADQHKARADALEARIVELEAATKNKKKGKK